MTCWYYFVNTLVIHRKNVQPEDLFNKKEGVALHELVYRCITHHFIICQITKHLKKFYSFYYVFFLKYTFIFKQQVVCSVAAFKTRDTIYLLITINNNNICLPGCPYCSYLRSNLDLVWTLPSYPWCIVYQVHL